MNKYNMEECQGLYNADDFRDNCGFGLIAHLDGEPSHRLLQTAIQSLTCMTHRGGIAADGRTGDGCGLLLKLPERFFRQALQREQQVDLGSSFGVGMVFLDPDSKQRQRAQSVIEAQLQKHGLVVKAWRKVPIDNSVCGDIAQAQLPYIAQVFIEPADASSDCTQVELNRKLFLARRHSEFALTDDSYFHVVSMSASIIGYKGLVMPADLPVFYLDLGSSDLETAICVFHQRFSTNTLPKWALAQPFRYLAHNGEINTIMGNRNWSVARTSKFETSYLPDLQEIAPLVNRTGSDSSSLDNMLEILLLGGMDLFRAVRMLIPPAWQNVNSMDPKLKAFYEYNSMHMEPWDGPAGIVLTDGRYAVCLLDRNGLRPARWVMTKDRFITLASEIGTYDYAPSDVVAKGRVGPGQILAVDTQTGEVLHTQNIDDRLKVKYPYSQWLKSNAYRIHSRLVEETCALAEINHDKLLVTQKMFQVSLEERNQVLRPMAELGQEAVGSMGDDTPMAVLSHRIRPLADYFRQQFAQVTNPPIDPLRESVVMSLETCIGRELNIFEETPAHARRIILKSPILSHSKFKQLLSLSDQGYPSAYLDLNYDRELSLAGAIKQLCEQAEKVVRAGKTILVLSDSQLAKDRLPINAMMATGAVHHHLMKQGLRCEANLILETGVARDPHQFAVLLGFGATAIYPYLAYQIINDLVECKEILNGPVNAQKNYRQAIAKGLLKILSKMGISTISSYRGAQLFEVVGVSREVVDLCFIGSVSRIEGLTFADFEIEQKTLAVYAWSKRKALDPGGILKYVHGTEYHAFNPDVVQSLHVAVRSGRYEDYKVYSSYVAERGIAHLRDLLVPKSDCLHPIPIEQVEPIESILKRFDSAGMSLGALSPEAHESIAVAMNRLGARSNSGEGGEDASRFKTERVSKIKQVASGRFGVTPHYLVNAEVIQIKIAQGAKPGEGGQLPGGKVNELIARLRYSVAGVTLISPPPHHDIYSIEDLAQLIFDLKQVNPGALVSVKLVSEPGVGTIAAGVAKAYADLITISGYDGGTAASPITSIRYAGSPWELGLSEAHQALRANDLRDKVRLQTDGGLKNGLDVIKAAILGAESFGFGTAPMIALGCKYLRICHLNNCATGVATQQEVLRNQHYIGETEMVMNFFRFIARETREWLGELGFSTLEEIVGRTDLLEVIEGITNKHKHLSLKPLLENKAISADKPQNCQVERNDPFDKAALAEQIHQATAEVVLHKLGGRFSFNITNCDRSIGARLSGEIAKRYGNQGMTEHPIVLQFKGTAGQSFGVWNAGGLHLYLEGDANDYVGKGMTGGKIVIKPPVGSTFKSNETSIVGNTCLYGATGGQLYAAGTAGERFGVRNSGAIAVTEGVGDHCCEYMTGGLVVVLGSTGCNFGAGMTGGFAYTLDLNNRFTDQYNRELIDVMRITHEAMEEYQSYLYDTLNDFVKHTNSGWGQHVLKNFEDFVGRFWLIKPKATDIQSLLNHIRARPE